MDTIEQSRDRRGARTKLAARLGIDRPEVRGALTRVDVAAVLKSTGFETLDHELDHHVTLTPRIPYVDGRGHLDVLAARSYWGEEGRIDLLPGADPEPNPRVEIWLDGLELDTAYAAVIRVAGAAGDGARFHVRTSEGTPQDFTVAPFDVEGQLLVVFLPAGRELDMALLRVEAFDTSDWMFYDVTVTKFGS